MTIPVDVVTVWAPRRTDAHWRDDYLDLLRLQRATAERFGHRHVVVTDDPRMYGFDFATVSLPDDLMPAMIAGVVAWLDYAVRCDPRHVVFVDADCLVARDLSVAFGLLPFDLGLTSREDPIAPINNGAMYVSADALPLARAFFARALARCGTHWGADQEAISAEAAPVPLASNVVEDRGGLRLGFFSMRTHGVVPKAKGARHYSDPFVVHFKGETKDWAELYAKLYILPDC